MPPPVKRAKARAGLRPERRVIAPRGRLSPRDPEQEPHPDQGDHQGRATVGDERERDARHGQRVDDTADVDHRLRQDPTGDPDRDIARERVPLPRRDPKARPAEGAEAREDREGSHQAQVAGYDGEDEVGVGIGEEPPGRHRRPHAASGHTAEPQGGEGLHNLVPARRGMGERVDERQQPVAGIGGLEGDQGAGDEDRGPGQDQEPEPGTCREEHREGDAADHDGRPEVGLLDNQDSRHRHEQKERTDEGLPLVPAPCATGQHVRGKDDKGQLHQLGGLELERADPDPTARTAREMTEAGHEDHDQKAEGRAEKRETEFPDQPHRGAAHDERNDHAQAHVDGLADDIGPGRAPRQDRRGSRRRQHDRKPEEAQAAHRGRQHLGLEAQGRDLSAAFGPGTSLDQLHGPPGLTRPGPPPQGAGARGCEGGARGGWPAHLRDPVDRKSA